MATSPTERTHGPCKVLAFAAILTASLLNGIMAQEEEAVTTIAPALEPDVNVRGDMIPQTAKSPEKDDPQVIVFPTVGPLEPTEQNTTSVTPGEVEDHDDKTAAAANFASEVHTNVPKVTEPETPAAAPGRGDGPANRPQVVAQADVVCVSKEAVQNRNAVNLKLKTSSYCENSKAKIESVLQALCGEDCKLDIFQEDNSDEVIVSGKYVEADVSGMTNKFNNDNIKDKTGVENAVTHWGKRSKLVLVSLLLSGLLLAALLVAGYYLKTHRKNSKGLRLAESYQVDEENQANTLVSVAPLPQEPLDKPTVNGESPPENGNNPTPATNGHSASQTPVADTEM